MRGLKGIERLDDLDPPGDRLGLGFGKLAFFGELVERARDRVAGSGGGAGLRIEEQGARAALREDLRDATAHRARADDGGNEIGTVSVQQGDPAWKGKIVF